MTPTRRIRVLVVDDVAIVRRLVTEALASDPALEVVGAEANGRLALERIPQLHPDVIILDYENLRGSFASRACHQCDTCHGGKLLS